MTINQQDFITPITGNVAIQNNGARFVLVSNADANFGFEGDESFKLILRKGSNTGPIVATTVVLVVRDTSNTITYDSLIESADTVAEGDTISFVLNTTNLGPNTTLYYNTVGNVTSSLFASGNTGSFLTTGNTYTLNFTTTSTVPDNETRFFQLEIREDSASGPVKITSNVINVVDSLQAFVTATGGFEIIEDNYRIHVFKSSNTFSVVGLGLPDLRTIEYLVVAGGGSASISDFPSGTSSGAGAGGFRTGNLTLTQTDSYTVTVGSGGATGGTSFGNAGNPSVLGNPGTPIFIESAGGGRGVHQQAAQSGGSGGGSSYNPNSPSSLTGGAGNVPPVSPPQGNPGGNSSNVPARGAGGGGAGAAGTPAESSGAGGIGRSINWQTPVFLSTFFGAPGPTPGRWFAGGGGRSNAAGGAGGGNAGPTVINTGGGGRGGSPATGAPGIVMVRYPYTVKTFSITDDLFQPGSIVQGSNITYSLSTINVSNNTSLYYTTSGNVTTSDFVGGNTGSFTVVAANATFGLSIANNIVSGGDTKEFALQLREGSVSGPVVASANTVTVYSQDPINFISATGGTISSANGYSIHTFTSSNTFTINSSGIFNTLEYLIIGGGGGGGFSNGSGVGAGGGGAGGYITNVSGETSGGNTPALATISGSVSPGTSFNVEVGAGGQVNTPGGNSFVEFHPSLINGGTKIALGGGAGGTGGSVGNPGGSGGGGAARSHPTLQPAGGSGTTGQGFSGGKGQIYITDTGGGGGGAGGAGTQGPYPGFGYFPSGSGGTGIPSRITGFNTYRAGGGVGGHGGGALSGSAGTGGGGTWYSAGTQFTGSGGGGGSRNPAITGTAGGSGIVIIRYLKP